MISEHINVPVHGRGKYYLKLISSLVLLAVFVQAQDQTQAQINNYNNQFWALYDTVWQNYYVMYSLQSELQYFSTQVPLFNQQMGTINAQFADIDRICAVVNASNKIWAANFKIMESAFAQLKKKYNLKT